MDKRLAPSNAATGVPGLDEILFGGFTKGALFLVEGNPGTGKTTLDIDPISYARIQAGSDGYIIITHQ